MVARCVRNDTKTTTIKITLLLLFKATAVCDLYHHPQTVFSNIFDIKIERATFVMLPLAMPIKALVMPT